MLDGLIDFSRAFSGRLWLEIFIMDGINASPADADRFKPLVEKIAPKDVYVNTAVRPPSESFVKQVGEEVIDYFYQTLGLPRQRDTVFSLNDDYIKNNIGPAILEMAARRPVTVEDMAAGLAAPVEKINQHVQNLLAEKRLEKIEKNASTYFRTQTFHAEP